MQTMSVPLGRSQLVRMHACTSAACTRWAPAPTQLGMPRALHSVVAAAKGKRAKSGFGDSKDVGGTGGGDNRRARQKARRLKQEQSPIPGQRAPGSLAPSMLDVERLESDMQRADEDAEFAARLAVVKQEGQQKQAALAPSSSSPPGSDPLNAQPVFDAPSEDIYAAPPKLSDTLLSKMNEGVSDPALKKAQFGPSQIGLAAGAIVFGLIFVLSSGGDLTPSKRYRGVQAGMDPPDAIQSGMLKARIGQLENQREANPSDFDALEEEAVVYAQLFEFDKAAKLLDKLTKARPDDAQAWRLLGETTLLMQQPGRSAAAYEKAAALDSSDMSILTGYADAFIANGQQAKAVERLNKLRAARPSAATSTSSAAMTSSTSSADGSEGRDDAVASTPDDSEDPALRVDDVSLDLLLAKVYSGWRGHDNDALKVYDDLIQRMPSDFRGYLAKGLFLKEQGRKADAERMFLQARFYAPEERQEFVKEMSSSNPVLDLPDND